ncbi:MAG: SAM-dependent methyltransferase, partial [Myxococcales bacterium]|nr:SAM-dependent methyltransferase [Myxococcales bacterium]
MIAFSRSLLPLSLVILSACGAAPSPGNAAGTAPAKSEAQSPSEEAEAATDPIQDAIANPSRSEEDRLRDADRNPGDVLRFFQIAPGMAVADLMTGKGYYAEILARVVGEGGRVYAQNTPFVVERFADAPLSERLARPGLENVVRVDRELTDLGLEPGSL